MQIVGRMIGPLTRFSFVINSLIEGYISLERYEKHIFGYTPHRATTAATRGDGAAPLVTPSERLGANLSIRRETEVAGPGENFSQNALFIGVSETRQNRNRGLHQL